MKDGGSEKGWDGRLLMCVIRHDLKWSVAFWGTNWGCCSGGKLGDAGVLSGLDPLELHNDGVSGRIECRGKACACGAELSVYMVLKGISYVPGYARRCSRIQGKAEPSVEDEVLLRKDILIARSWLLLDNVQMIASWLEALG